LRQYVRTIRATLDPVERRWREAQRCQRHRALPAAGPAVVAVAITVLEVQAGLRPPHQLERLSHHSLWGSWTQLPDLPNQNPAPIRPRLIALTVQELVPGLVDATAVVDFAGHPHALALRLDGAQGFWQLVELDYPTGPAIPGPVTVDRRRVPRGPNAPDRTVSLCAEERILGDRDLMLEPDSGLGIELE
jgi:hypothetical protein